MSVPVSGVPSKAGTWLHVESEHFEMISAASEKMSQQLLVELEQFRILFLAMINPARTHEPRPLIVVFETGRAFRPYLPIYKGKPRDDVSGYCLYSPSGIYIALTGRGEHLSRASKAIFHEYTHALVMQSRPRIPVWVNEGLAKVFETFSISGDRVTIGAGDPRAAAWLRLAPPIDMDEFLAAGHGSRHYSDPRHTGIFYSQAWVIMHYLMFSITKDAEAFDLEKFLQLLEDRSLPAREAVRLGTGMPPDELLHKVVRLARDDNGYRYRPGSLTVPAKAIRSALQTRSATPLEVELALLGLRWRVHRGADTQLKLLELSDRQPDSPRPHEMLAEFYFEEGRRKDAAGHWQRAAELGSKNAFVYLALAGRKIGALRLAPDYRLPDELCAELRGRLDRAIALDPNYMEAYGLLALVEAFSVEPREDALRKIKEGARDISRWLERVRLLLAGSVMLWRGHQYERSLEHVRALQVLLDVRVKAGDIRPIVTEMQETARLLEARIRRDMDASIASPQGDEPKGSG